MHPHSRSTPFPYTTLFRSLEAWRHFGYLRWNLLLSDEDRYFENTKWAARVRSRAAAAKTLEPRHGVAFQRRVRSEERRVGKECRCRWGVEYERKNRERCKS